jgi:hypothetical protein
VRALLGDAAADLPPSVRVAPNEFSHYKPTAYYADRVLVFGTPPDGVAVIVEVQRRFDDDKRRSWPFYVASVWARDGCDVILLVLCDDPKVAEQYGKPIQIGRAAVVTPDVVGPDQIPVVRDVELARALPELSVISSILHNDRTNPEQIFIALGAALMTVGTDLGRMYHDLVFAEVPEARRAHLLEVLMNSLSTEYRSEYNRALFAEGKASGEAKAIVIMLETKGLTLSAEERNRITACTDLDQLDAWLHRVGSVTTVSELFG